MKILMLLSLLAFESHGATKTCSVINCLYSKDVLHACFKWNSGTLDDAKKYVEAEANGPGQVVMVECVDAGKEPIVVKSERQGMNVGGGK